MNTYWLPSSRWFPLWLFAAAAMIVLSSLHEIEQRFAATQLQQADEALLAEILANVPYDNDLREDVFLLGPDAGAFVQNNLLGLTANRTGYIVRQEGRPVAFVLPVETLAGFNGSIQLLVGIRVNGEITGVRVVAHNETPGLGGQIELAFSNWVLAFNNRSLANTDPLLWRVKKDGGEFDQFAGATITPRAVVAAIRDTLEFFAANRDVLLTMDGTELPVPETEGHLNASAGITTWLVAMMQPVPLLLLGLLLALKNFLAPGQAPRSAPPADSVAGSKRVRVTGKS